MLRTPFALALGVSFLVLTPLQAAPVLPEAAAFAGGYIDFLDQCRTEVESVVYLRAAAEAAGYRDLETLEAVAPGDKVYRVNHDRAIILAVVGEQPVAAGVQMLGAHIDSPRLDLKAKPVYEKEGFYLFQTYPYGGIKRYQWANIPLQLHALWYDADGTRHHTIVGDDPGEPTLVIPDLEPHLSRDVQGERKSGDTIGAEEIDPLIGMASSRSPWWNDEAPADYMALLEESPEVGRDEVLDMLQPYLGGLEFGPVEFATGQFHLTPSMEPRIAGFDRSMVAGYGQDDRCNSYLSFRAILDLEATPAYTALAYLVGQEEIGSGNNTGAGSTFLNATIALLLERDARSGEAPYGDNQLRETLTRSWVISADTPAAVNPIFPDVWESGNRIELGRGPAVLKWGAGRDANPEFFARVAAIFKSAGVPWQAAPLGKNGAGGGGTIGGFMSQEGMEVIDIGVSLLSMHSPYELCSVNDLWWGYRGFQAFLESDREF